MAVILDFPATRERFEREFERNLRRMAVDSPNVNTLTDAQWKLVATEAWTWWEAMKDHEIDTEDGLNSALQIVFYAAAGSLAQAIHANNTKPSL